MYKVEQNQSYMTQVSQGVHEQNLRTLSELEKRLLNAPSRIGAVNEQVSYESCSCPCITCGEGVKLSLATGTPLHISVAAGTALFRIC